MLREMVSRVGVRAAQLDEILRSAKEMGRE
jgi:hypothetical protein